MFFTGTISYKCFQKKVVWVWMGDPRTPEAWLYPPDCLNLWPNLTHHLCWKAKFYQPQITTPIPLHRACSDCGSAGTQLFVYNSNNKNWLTDKVLDYNFHEDGTHFQGPSQCPRPRRCSVRTLFSEGARNVSKPVLQGSWRGKGRGHKQEQNLH